MSGQAEAVAVGGQAVIDGVMMRGADRWAVAVRRHDGAIELHVDSVPEWAARWQRAPVIRGVVALAASLAIGVRALVWSAEQGVPASVRSERATSRQRSTAPIWPAIALALVMVTGLFFVLPAVLAGAIAGEGTRGFHLTEAGVRLGLFLGYLVAIGRLADVRRVFEYHGAEHKAVSAYEQGAPLTPSAAARFGTVHPRCGTSFLLVVMAIAVVVHAVVDRPGWAWLIGSRVVVLPVVAGLAYEVLKGAARHAGRRLVRAVMAPALALQRLTTREPSLDQLEVALVALEAVAPEREKGLVAALAGSHEALPELVA